MDELVAKATEMYLYNNEIVYFVLPTDEVYGFNTSTASWFKKENFYDYFDSALSLENMNRITKEEAREITLEGTGK